MIDRQTNKQTDDREVVTMCQPAYTGDINWHGRIISVYSLNKEPPRIKKH